MKKKKISAKNRKQEAGKFNALERVGARLLEKTPGLRKTFKYAYQRFVYATRKKPSLRVILAHPVEISTVYEWAGVPVPPGNSFFGYYDKSPWNPSMRCILTHEISGDECLIIMLDRVKKERRIVESTACWNWQQGAMLQWAGDSNRVIAFNTLRDRQLGCALYDIETKTGRFVPWPVQAIHPKGDVALSLNYLRLHKTRPIYGYSVKADNFASDMNSEKDGIWRFDMASGRADLLISLSHLREECGFKGSPPENEHVNHCIFNPLGSKFAFLYRYSLAGVGYSRLCCASTHDGSFSFLHCNRKISHYHWEDESNLLVWMRTDEFGDHYYRIDVNEKKFTIVGLGVMDTGGDGHCSFSRNGKWIVSDTYPDKVRHQHLFIYSLDENRRVPIGSFLSPWRFYEDGRCDLHPRPSPDDRFISFDSAHSGSRMQYIVTTPPL